MQGGVNALDTCIDTCTVRDLWRFGIIEAIMVAADPGTYCRCV